MNELEQKLIEQYNTMDENYGYNLDSGGNSNWQVSEATREKLRLSHIGIIMPPEHRLHTSLHNSRNTAVYCIETQETYRSFAEAGRQLGNISPASIGAVCAGKQKSAGDLHFRYATEEEKNNIKEKPDEAQSLFSISDFR